ncbi:predicted protein [Sclerotinia sclerotiorum 1980 UF-70]|uniref:Uncharacterized protein n=1 Tax=Sclerotinia sclerotiorum (strain ATCC 18683 / 1980 / Ss-1) TaxID=665079 RepID=A7EUD5_SCLS1|nr:predicted protein [Sclerotinia sclerotiorum 1980 UF-70]EDN93077.1 predicted protein [Sclerotinia sclerotiorum 1980 UF-70]
MSLYLISLQGGMINVVSADRYAHQMVSNPCGKTSQKDENFSVPSQAMLAGALSLKKEALVQRRGCNS